MVWDRLFRLKQRGITLILTTHYMDEAEQLCDRLVVMDNGRIAAEGTPRELIARYSTREVLELRFAPGTSRTRRRRRSSGLRPERIEVLPTASCSTRTTATRCSARVARGRAEPITELVRRSTLEDVFLRLTGRTLVD